MSENIVDTARGVNTDFTSVNQDQKSVNQDQKTTNQLPNASRINTSTKKKKKRKQKKKTVENSTNTASENNKQPQTLAEKLHSRLNTMKSRRTGVERRKQEEALKANGEKPKNSNAMRNIARGEISELLSKMGINDPKLESEVMNEIMRGNLRTPAAIAEYLVQKLQLAYPRGAPKPKPQSQQNQPPTTLSENKESTNSSDLSATQNDVSEIVHGHKALKHPSPSLVVKTPNE
jgi:hypothetical protein